MLNLGKDVIKGRKTGGQERNENTLTVHFCFAAVRAVVGIVTSLTEIINSLFSKREGTSPSFNQCQQPITLFHHPEWNNTNVIKEENSWPDKISNSLCLNLLITWYAAVYNNMHPNLLVDHSRKAPWKSPITSSAFGAEEHVFL